MVDFNFKIKLKNEKEYKVYIFGFKPGRPAPFCDNPSSPAFGDPGDPDEWDSVDIYNLHGDRIPGFYLHIYGNQKIINKIIEIGNVII